MPDRFLIARPDSNLNPGCGAQLSEDPGEVGLNRLDLNRKRLRNLAVGMARRNKRGYLALADSQPTPIEESLGNASPPPVPPPVAPVSERPQAVSASAAMAATAAAFPALPIIRMCLVHFL